MNKDKLIKIASLLIILRDDLEDMQLSQDIKNKSNMLLKSINRDLKRICIDDDVNGVIMLAAQQIDKAINSITIEV